MTASRASVPEIARLAVASQADFLASPCKVSQKLMSKLRTSIDLIGKPYLYEIQDCSQSGCRYCWLVWHGVSHAMPTDISPNGAPWTKATSFGQVVQHDDGNQALRVGIVANGMDAGRVPREWVDFEWIRDNESGKRALEHVLGEC